MDEWTDGWMNRLFNRKQYVVLYARILQRNIYIDSGSNSQRRLTLCVLHVGRIWPLLFTVTFWSTVIFSTTNANETPPLGLLASHSSSTGSNEMTVSSCHVTNRYLLPVWYPKYPVKRGVKSDRTTQVAFYPVAALECGAQRELNTPSH